MADGFEFLAGQHREVERLFRQYAESPDDAVAREICEALTAHAEAEEKALYPELRRIVDGGDDLADDAEAQHAAAKTIIARIYDSPPEDLGPVVAELEREVAAHIRFEEDELFPDMAESGIDIDALDAQLHEAWRDAHARGSGETG